jgi:hypothetical protein
MEFVQHPTLIKSLRHACIRLPQSLIMIIVSAAARERQMRGREKANGVSIVKIEIGTEQLGEEHLRN